MKLAASVIAGASVLALANVALAEEVNLASPDQPVLLTDAQMDDVTAGFASISAGIVSGAGSGFVTFGSLSNFPDFASAFIEVEFSTNTTITGFTSAFASVP